MSPTRLLLGALLALAPAMAPPLAAASDVILYEIADPQRLDAAGQGAGPALVGRAGVGTPICPQALLKQVAPHATSCAIIVSGADTIHRTRSAGSLAATFTVVVDREGAGGSALVVAAGSFSSARNIAPALLEGVPYGTLTGSLKVDASGTQQAFSGVYRLSFLGTDQPHGAWGPTMRQIFCPATPESGPTATGSDLVWLETTDGLPNGRCLPITANELASGTPAVRLELSFPGTAAKRK